MIMFHQSYAAPTLLWKVFSLLNLDANAISFVAILFFYFLTRTTLHCTTICTTSYAYTCTKFQYSNNLAYFPVLDFSTRTLVIIDSEIYIRVCIWIISIWIVAAEIFQFYRRITQTLLYFNFK